VPACARWALGYLKPVVLEHAVKVHHILFLLWGIVFAFWLVKQFSDHNKRSEED
jgi:hypothetical protein